VYIFIVLENRDVDISTKGREALRDGKSLHTSGHVTKVKYHGVNANCPYSFIKSDVTRETSISLDPYHCWIIVHKERHVVVDGYCSCPGG
jgi:predicted nucleic acid-binding Zn finger protein